ncbi:uncharacterized protein C3orf20 homolog [Tupaia chinensis]|uniref:uncharacterized protein C3orf20 homolog n=1 Tax=Tupaia chinensis TaxID=246437 RepID=UPI0007040610|nr:uncharacterized protein C3orf20 homolog [Tupaia chinensis]
MDMTKATPLEPGPIYFFDQLKPERKTWRRRMCTNLFSHLEYYSRAKYSHRKKRKSKGLKKITLTTTATSEKEGARSLSISKSPDVFKLSPNIKFSKVHSRINLFEKCKLIAPEILYELEETLQKYAQCNIPFPVGLVNFLNYSWQDLTEGAYNYVSKDPLLEEGKALKRKSNSMALANLKERKISNHLRREYHAENHLVKPKKDHHVPSRRSMEKLSLVSQNQYSQMSQESDSPVVIHFSLTSKICLENGWIFPQPFSKLEIPNWKTVLGIAVKRLQIARLQIKTEEAKLKKGGLNQQLILSYYNEPESKEESQDLGRSQSFWKELLEGKSLVQMPAVRKADPMMKKFHYALVDGSSLTYYPSGRLAVCQSYSDLPWGGVYTNIFSDLPNQVILGTFTPFGCGSISLPNSRIVVMMFNQDGGLVISKNGILTREWMWPSKGKLNDPVEIWVNKFITVKISGRFAISLDYKCPPQSLKLSLAPVKSKPFPQCLHEVFFPDNKPISGEAKELLKDYKLKCKQLKFTAWNKDASRVGDPEFADTFDLATDISPLHDITTDIQLRRLQKKAKHIILCWLDHYRFAVGVESLHIHKLPKFLQKVVRRKNVLSAKFPLEQKAKEKDGIKEYLRYRNTFLELRGFFKPSPLHHIQRIPACRQSFRFHLPIKIKDSGFASQLVCPVVLRKILCGKEGETFQCSCHNIPEVTDLEYDLLISKQLSSVDQIIIVYVYSAKEKDKTVRKVARMYRKLNRSRNMPCIQSRLDTFRLLKYNIVSASKFTGSNCPLLVQRHNVIPGIFLMYIRGKLLFANFIFNGYSTSINDLQKQIVKTRKDYQMGYFLPSDFRIRAQSTSCLGNEDTLT